MTFILQPDRLPEFEFQLKLEPGSPVRRMPNMQDIPIDLRVELASAFRPVALAKARKQEPCEEDLVLLGELQIRMLERFSPNVSKLLNDRELATLFTEWARFSEVDLGKSQP